MIHYLLNTAPDGSEEVSRYSDAEMEEIFTAEQRGQLARGATLIVHYRNSRNHRITDMMVATRKQMGA